MTRHTDRDTGVSADDLGSNDGGDADRPAARTRRREFIRVLGAGALVGGVGAGPVAAQSGDATATVRGGGADVWNASDAFHYFFTDAGGDFDLVARVDSLENTDEYAKAGLMVRESLAADAKNVLVRQTPSSTSVQWRSEAGATSESLTSDEGSSESEVDGGTIQASWQRLVRDGDVIRAYASTDGSDWTLLAELTALDFSAGVFVGLAVTSHSTGTLCTAEFSGLSGFQPAHSRDVGDVDVAGSASGGALGSGVDPLVATRNASGVETDAATLGGSLIALGDASSVDVSLQYREVGASTWQSTSAGTLSSTGEFTATATGLSGGTDYEFRAVAATGDGDPVTGAAVPFSTLRPDTDPVVTTGDATSVASTTATLNGTLEDLGGRASTADVSFEYRAAGADEWQSSETETLESPGEFGVTVFGLSTGTDHEFRAVVEADDGDADQGSAASFTSEEGADDDLGAYFDPADGFATPAPWLDDDTPVYKVTEPTRENFANAVKREGPRVIVFECSGVIDLSTKQEHFQIENDKCWIAGQTAPSPGITFVGNMLQVDASDCVVQHVRSRIGPGLDGDIQGNDAFNTEDGTTNNVVDHVTASWGTDECMSVGYDTSRTTYANCLIYEGLWDPYGNGSDHNYGMLVGDGAEDVALLGNVLAKARSRMPRLKGNTRSVVANNLVYFFDKGAKADGSTVTSFVGNAYLGSVAPDDNYLTDGEAYLEDNLTADPPQDPDHDFHGGTVLDSKPLWPSGLDAMHSNEVEGHNLEYAGARPADRTANDERIVREIRNRAGAEHSDTPRDYWIPAPSAVGGYPELPVNRHTLEVPDSGLREWLQQWALAVEEPTVDPPSSDGDGTPEPDGPPAVGENASAPRDPDEDGLYEDVNGDGATNLADAGDLFQHRNGDAVQNNVDAYDFSGNDEIDLADVVQLFTENAN